MEIAAVHASAMSIFLGVLGLYLVYHHGRRRELKERVLKTPRQVNSLPWPGSTFHDKRPEYHGDTAEKRRKLRRRLTRLVAAGDKDDIPPRDEHKARGREARKVLGALVHFYPFPKRIHTSGDSFGGSRRPEDIAFSETDDVREWLSEVKHLKNTIDYLTGFYGVYFEKILDAAPDRLRNDISPMMRGDLQRPLQLQGDPQSVLLTEPYLLLIQLAGEIARETRTRLSEYDVYISQQPHRGYLIGAVALLGVGFVTGVILPVLYPCIPRPLIVYPPLLVYVLGFVVLFYLSCGVASTEG